MPAINISPPFEAYNGSEPFLFVSYAHKDGAIVFPELLYLYNQGYRIWYDEGIDPGNEWPNEVAAALEGCSQFLVFISPNATRSSNVRNEVNFAINHSKAFLAVHIDETPLPIGLELRMGDIQAILKYRMDEEHYHRQLGRALKSNIGDASSHASVHVSSGEPLVGRSGTATDGANSEQSTNEYPVDEQIVVNEDRSVLQDDLVADGEIIQSFANKIVIDGSDVALKDFRFVRVGGLDVVDPREVDGFLDIQSLVREYARVPQRIPLSIAVFGPPGSAKMFGVQQIVLTVLPFSTETCLFSMSSFVDVNALIKALHQVREIAATGKTPLVFWDDFDAPNAHAFFGWLRYLIPTMDFGSYLDGQTTYQVGGSIFVFLSGTASRFEDFGSGLPQEQCRDVKIPDFLSCLRGYLNVMGPNPMASVTDPNYSSAQAHDPYYVIRRAAWLRHLLRRKAPNLFQEVNDRSIISIDPGVVYAFLKVKNYRHGLRSMEAVISMSRLAGRSYFGRQSLPSKAQLGLHVNGDEFLSLVQAIAP